MNSLEQNYQIADQRLTMVSSDLNVVGKKIGVTTKELEDAQAIAIQLKKENTQLERRLRTGLATKADTKAVTTFHQEQTSKLNAVQQEATTRMDGITGDVSVVRADLDATRNDLNSARADLNATRDDVANSRRDLGTLIARNSSELAELRRKGERDYVEFEVRKSNQFNRVGDVLVQLKKTDVKKQKYEVVLNTDDQPIQKKDRTANEPVTFLVGKDRVRYEMVVNLVDKDKIRGYISAPKDRLTASEGPSPRVQ